LRAARSAGYLSYSEADFEVVRPAGATRCTDVGEIWHDMFYATDCMQKIPYYVLSLYVVLSYGSADVSDMLSNNVCHALLYDCIVSGIAIFVLKRDIKLQLTN